jgi:hypothetical protein
MDSLEAASHFADNSIDMVFIDADHEIRMCKRDLEAWSPKCKFLCGHDKNEGGVAGALHDMGISILSGPGTIWIADRQGIIPAYATGPNELVAQSGG